MPFSRMSGSKMRSTAFSPNAVGMVETRSSTSRPPWSRLMRPPLLGEVAAGEELDARDHRLVHDLRDQVHVVQDPVDPEADEGQLALRLEVDVRGPLLERVAEDVVEGLHHRRGGGIELGGLGGQEL